METPGNTLHAPHTHKPDAGGSQGADLLPHLLSTFSLFVYSHCPWALSLQRPHSHIYTHPQSPSLLFRLAPQLRPCYCCKLWQELGCSRPIRINGCIILLNSCPLNFKPQDKGRITDWLTDSNVILKSKEGENLLNPKVS